MERYTHRVQIPAEVTLHESSNLSGPTKHWGCGGTAYTADLSPAGFGHESSNLSIPTKRGCSIAEVLLGSAGILDRRQCYSKGPALTQCPCDGTVDMPGSEPGVGNGVWVRIPLRAPNNARLAEWLSTLLTSGRERFDSFIEYQFMESRFGRAGRGLLNLWNLKYGLSFEYSSLRQIPGRVIQPGTLTTP